MTKTKDVKRSEIPKEAQQPGEPIHIVGMPDAARNGPIINRDAEGGQPPPPPPPQETRQAEDLSPELTAAETADFERLEEVFSQGQRESIAALREIRQRKLYRAKYKTFDDYVEERWHHSRQWATQQINWLRRTELLEANGNDRYQKLTVDDAKVLGELDDYPDEFVQAIVQAEERARQVQKPRTKKMLGEAVEQQLDYINRRRRTREDLTWDEYLALEPLGGGRLSHPNLVEQAQEQARQEGKPLLGCLVALCEEHGDLPTDSHLLSVARGDALAELVRPLAALRANWEQEHQLEQEQTKLEAKLEEVKKKRQAKQASVPSDNSARHQDGECADGNAPTDDSADQKPAAQESRQEPEESDSPFEVEVTGDFAHLLQFENKAGLSLANVVELLLNLADAIQEDGMTKASLVIRSDEEAEDEDEEDSFDLDDGEEEEDQEEDAEA